MPFCFILLFCQHEYFPYLVDVDGCDPHRTVDTEGLEGGQDRDGSDCEHYHVGDGGDLQQGDVTLTLTLVNPTVIATPAFFMVRAITSR